MIAKKVKDQFADKFMSFFELTEEHAHLIRLGYLAGFETGKNVSIDVLNGLSPEVFKDPTKLTYASACIKLAAEEEVE